MYGLKPVPFKTSSYAGALRVCVRAPKSGIFPVARGGEGLFGRMADYPTQAKTGKPGLNGAPKVAAPSPSHLKPEHICGFQRHDSSRALILRSAFIRISGSFYGSDHGLGLVDGFLVFAFGD